MNDNSKLYRFQLHRIHDLQFGLHQYKEEVLAENPIVTVCIEMFETLETVEDYILNKLNSGDSAMNIEEKIFEKSKEFIKKKLIELLISSLK